MPQPFSYSTTTPGIQLTEEQRRRKLLDRELGEVRDWVTPDQYEELLERQKRFTPINQVDQTIGYTPSGVEQRGPDSSTANAIERARSTLRRSYGQAIDQERDVFGADFQERKIPRYLPPQSAQEERMELGLIEQSVRQFGDFRQQLTQNYQRLDPFAKVQYNELNKRIMGLQRARTGRKVSPMEYLREMDHLASEAKEIDWKQHMLPPGSGRGEISTNPQGVIMFQGEKGPEMVGLTPDYVRNNTIDIGRGMKLVPTLKNGKIEMKELKPGEKLADFQGLRDAEEEYDKIVDEQFEKNQRTWQQYNPLTEPTEEDYSRFDKQARAFARWKMKSRRDDVRALYDDDYPDRPAESPVEPDVASEQEQSDLMRQGFEEGMQQAKQENELVKQEAISQVMEDKDLDVGEATQLVEDDMYASSVTPLDVQQKRMQYNHVDYLQSIGVGEEHIISYASQLRKAKTKREKDSIRAEFWQRDPILAMKALNPVVVTPGMKKMVGEVYLTKRKDGKGYMRVWKSGENKYVKLMMPSEKEKEARKKRSAIPVPVGAPF